jgi:hypothetical protein
MDAAYPDFVVVLLLNPLAHPLSGAVLPGNMIGKIFPLIAELHHGSLPVYVGAPFYALLGTDIVGLRMVHGIFAAIVLVGLYVLLRSFGVRSWLAALTPAVLAIDPAFLFSFRTQFYITALPIAFIFLAAASVNWASATSDRRAATFRLSTSGLLAGIATYGYFIHTFFAAAVFAFALSAALPLDRKQRVIPWLGGFIIGVSPYIIGSLLFLAAFHFSPSAALDHVRGVVDQLKIPRPAESLMDRITYAGHLFHLAATNIGNNIMMFKDPLARGSDPLRLAILFGLPLAALALSEAFRRGSSLIRFAAGCVLASFVMVLIFGSRLWVHHAAPLVPVFYLALAGAVSLLLPMAERQHRLARQAVTLACILPLATLICLNLRDRGEVFQALQETRGVGMFSDAITRFAEDNISSARKTYYVFPDWGLTFPFILTTRGNGVVHPTFDVDTAMRELCAGKDMVIAYFPQDDDERQTTWVSLMNSGEPDVTIYRQRNGTEVVRALRWPAGSCKRS